MKFAFKSPKVLLITMWPPESLPCFAFLISEMWTCASKGSNFRKISSVNLIRSSINLVLCVFISFCKYRRLRKILLVKFQFFYVVRKDESVCIFFSHTKLFFRSLTSLLHIDLLFFKSYTLWDNYICFLSDSTRNLKPCWIIIILGT